MKNDKEYIKICQNHKCNKKFTTFNNSKKYCCEECAKYIHQQQKYHYQRYQNIPCEMCGKEHDHSFGSGRFCSKECKNKFIANQSKHSEKKLAHLKKIHELRRKNKIERTKPAKYIEKISNSSYKCLLCGKEFNNSHAIRGHIASCPNHPRKEYHKESHKKAIETLKRHLRDGTVIHRQTGHPLTKETREKISKSTINRIYDANHQYCRSDVKYYDIKNNKGELFKVRGTWELNVAKELNRLNIEWDNKTYLKYKTDITRHYHPDFHLKSSNIFIEVKGFYTEGDKKKMSAVLESNKDIQIYFLHNNYREFENKNMLLFEACTLLTKDNVFHELL